tara:strand:+ start:133 stop:816 length:684 start_codon:yes stop_codon:yes gene_type:complete
MKKNRILTESEKRQIIDDKQKAIVESFASVFNRIKRINESEIKENIETDSSGYEWFKSTNIPMFDNYQSIQNMKSNKLLGGDMNGYFPYVMKNVDSRDYGKYLGDAVMSFLKNLYINKIKNIGSAKSREFLQNPKVVDASTNEEDVKNALEANKFIASIPDIEGSKYLENDENFSRLIAQTVNNMIAECLENNYVQLVPLILPWVANVWKRKVIDKIMSQYGNKSAN